MLRVVLLMCLTSVCNGFLVKSVQETARNVCPMSTAPTRISATATASISTETALWMNKNNNRDVSRSGTKRDRLDRLAELEQDRATTDKSFVLKAAGAFVALLILIAGVGAATGAFDDLFYQM